MRTATHSEREKFVALVVRHCPNATASTCQRLMRLGATFGRLARSHDRTIYQTEKMTIIGKRLERQAKELKLGVWYPTPGQHSYAVALTNGDGFIVGIPTS